MRRAVILLASLAMLGPAIAAQRNGPQDVALQAAIRTETVDGDLRKAIAQYEVIAKGSDRALAATALIRMAECYEKLGGAESRRIYEEVVQRFADQAAPAATARMRLAALRSPASLATGQTARQIWVGPGVWASSISPDGRYLSLQIGNTGDLAIRDLVAGTTRNLTNSGGWVASGDYVEDSVISPDGREVAYLWFIDKESKYELRVISIASGGSAAARTVLRTELSDYVAPVAWTPDGRQLVVSRSQNRAWQIGTVSLENGSFRSLKSLEWRNPGGFSLSPDGRFLAYDVPASTNGSSRDIFLLATDGSRETTLVHDPANDTSPLWSPDGSTVLFLSDRTGTASLWSQTVTAGVPDGAPVLTRPDMGGARLLGMTRTGAMHYLVRGMARRNVHVADFDGARVSRSALLATEDGPGAYALPAWSHDGQYLAYYSSRNPRAVATRNPTALVIRTVSTGVERVVPLPIGFVNSPATPGPRWFPDNRAVLVLVRDAQGPGLAFYRFDLDATRTDFLWRVQNPGAFAFDLSPDGRSIFCAFQVSSFDSAGPSGGLVRFDIDSRRETVLKKDEWFIAVAVSPDGAELAFLKSVRGNTKEAPSVVEVMPTTGGPAREVYRHPVWLDGSRYNTLAWTPDQRYLLFVRGELRGEDSTQTLWRVPLAGGPPEEVGVVSSAGDIKSPAVRPDGKQIAFARSQVSDNEILALENFLPPTSAKR